VAASRATPGLTMELADSKTLKSLTLQTHHSKWTTRGTTAAFCARKADRSAIAGADSLLAPLESSLSLSLGVANSRRRLLDVLVVSRAKQTM